MGLMSRIKGRLGVPSPALIVALIALGAALGGTAVALPGSRTVQANDLKTGSVNKRAIRADAVRPSEIDDGAVQDAELGTIVTRVDINSVPDGATGRAEAACLDGEKLIGGGGGFQQSGVDALFHESRPGVGGGFAANDGDEFDTWDTRGTNLAGSNATLDLKSYAVCLQ